MGHELITLQFGPLSNEIGANVWNFRHDAIRESATRGGSAPSSLPRINPEVFYRSKVSRSGTGTGSSGTCAETYSPRALIFDVRGSKGIAGRGVGGMEAGRSAGIGTGESKTQIVSGLVSSSVRPMWQGALTCVDRSETPAPAAALSSGVNRVSSEGGGGGGGWLASMKDPLRSSGLRTLPTMGQFDVFAEGVSKYRHRSVDGSEGEEAYDAIRVLLEECDSVQGFVISVDVDSAFGGFASELLLELRDECASVPRIAFGVVPSFSSGNVGTDAKAISRRRLNVGFGCAALADAASLWCPVVAPYHCTRSTTTRLVASALDSISAPLYIDPIAESAMPVRLRSVVASLVPRPSLQATSLLVACPLLEGKLATSPESAPPLTETQLRALFGDDSKFPDMRSLSPQSLGLPSTSTDEMEQKTTEFSLYGVLRGCARINASAKRYEPVAPSSATLAAFNRAMRRRCRRATSAYVGRSVRLKSFAGEFESARHISNRTTPTKTRYADERRAVAGGTAKSAPLAKSAFSTNPGVSSLTCLSNSTAIGPFLNRTARGFGDVGNRAMLGYFAEVGLDSEDYEAVRESLTDAATAYGC